MMSVLFFSIAHIILRYYSLILRETKAENRKANQERQYVVSQKSYIKPGSQHLQIELLIRLSRASFHNYR